MTPNFFQKTISKAMVLLVALTCLQSQSLLLNTAHAADSTISGKTFYDTNKNGINDAGDQILPFLKVSLYDGATLVQGPISIDTTGTYQFTVSTTSTYHVEFSNLPPNYSFSPGNIGSDETIDSDVETVNGLGAGNTGDMFVMGSQTVTDVDAGAYVDTVHVGDYVFQDINTNGIQDSGDSVLTGATASLYNYNSGILGTDTTDIAGHYGINATIPACIGPNGFWNSGNSNMDCTGINVAGGYYDLTFTTSADCQDFGIGISLVAADGSTLFNAMCGAGISDLKNSSSYNFRVGPEVGTGTAHLNFTETGSSHGIGNIMLTYSKLIVTFSGLPMGYGFTSKFTGSDRTVDSDVNNDGNTDILQLFAGDSSDEIDAGVCNPCAPSGTGSISGIVWNDANGNGIYESGSESQYGGVNIFIYDANTDSQIDGQGSTGIAPFTFSNMSAGDYYLVFSNIPPSASFSPQNAGVDDTLDSDVDASGRTNNFHLNDGESLKNLSAGIYGAGGGGGGGGGPSGSGSISGIVWDDANGNGIYESASESQYGGVNIFIYDANTDSQISGQGSTGLAPFTFSNMSAGDYYLVFSNIPPSASFSPQNAGADDTVDSDVDASGRTNNFHLNDGESLTNLSAGIYGVGGGGGGGGGPSGSGSISGIVWNDANGNGIYESASESQYGGASIYVYDANTDSQIGGQGSTGSGPFTFSNMSAGDYYLVFSKIPPSASFSPQNAGVDDTVDSDVDASGRTNNFHLNDGESLTNLSAGIYGAGDGGGGGGGSGSGDGVLQFHVFTDTNGNGIQDAGEPNGASGTITLSNGSDGMDLAADGDGNIAQSLAESNTYSLTFTLPEGAYVTGRNNPITDISIFSGYQTDLGNIGIYTGIVAGFDLHLFTDNNNNGTQDEGEANGASKVYLVIDGHSESAIPFPTDGTLHANLAPGEYTFSLLSYADGPTSFTGNNANLDTGVVLTLGTTDFGNVGYFSGSGGGGDGDSCETPCGILILHIFTDTNGNGTQESFEPNGASDTSVRVQGGDFNQVVTLDENGDVNGGVYPASYTLTIINPTGTTITGGGNPIHITVIDGDTVNAGSRGIFITTSGGSGGGGGGGGGVVFGGGGSSGGSSGSQSSGWTASSSNNNRSSSNSSNSSSSTKPATVAETPTPQPHTLPVVTPHEEACLLTGGTTPINFYDGTTPDTDFLSGIIFNHNAANRLLHGDGNGHFAGNLPMTRFELLKVALSSNCVAGGNFNTPNSHFSDVNHDQSEQSRVIGEAHARGIITGFNNQFYPNRPVTLGELMKILMGSSAYFPNGIPAADLPVTETGITEPSFVQPIEYAKLLGIIGGDGKPVDQNSVVTRDEMAILIARYIKAMNHLVIAN